MDLLTLLFIKCTSNQQSERHKKHTHTHTIFPSLQRVSSKEKLYRTQQRKWEFPGSGLGAFTLHSRQKRGARFQQDSFQLETNQSNPHPFSTLVGRIEGQEKQICILPFKLRYIKTRRIDWQVLLFFLNVNVSFIADSNKIFYSQ